MEYDSILAMSRFEILLLWKHKNGSISERFVSRLVFQECWVVCWAQAKSCERFIIILLPIDVLIILCQV